jgi:hypothetical protein
MRSGGCQPCQLVLSDDGRLVTLTGVGGCGKARLAIELSRRLVEQLWGGKTSLGGRSAMLTPCLTFSGSCSQQRNRSEIGLRRIPVTVQAVLRPRQDLVLENLLLRHQITVLTRPTRRRSHARLRLWDKLLWVIVRRFCAGWREHLSIVTPETVVRWHRQGWRLFWRWKSRSQGGRPHLGAEVQDLIATMSRDNRLWGSERIRGELLKLGIVVSNRSIRRYRWRGPGRAPTQTWRAFRRNHAHHLWAAIC